MARLVWDNFATTTLNEDISDSATSFSVAAGGGAIFPNPTGGNYAVLVTEDALGAKEIMHLTARSGDIFTVTRAEESTFAQAYTTGDRVELRVTRGFLEDFIDGGEFTSTGLTIRVRRSASAGLAPSTLLNGEFAINVADTPPTAYVGDGTSVLKLGVHVGTSLPSSPAAGTISIHPTTKAMQIFASGTWSLILADAPNDGSIYARQNAEWVAIPPPFENPTRMLFVQASAPTGWTRITTWDDASLRVVDGNAGVSSGGSSGFTATVFGAGKSTDEYAITTAQLPSHRHYNSSLATGPGGAHSHTFSPRIARNEYGVVTGLDVESSHVGFFREYEEEILTNTVGPHTHSGISGFSDYFGSGGTHSHPLGNMNLKYVDAIVCEKD